MPVSVGYRPYVRGRRPLPVFLAGAGVIPDVPLISSINGEGWSAQWASGTPPTFTPDSSPITFTASRQGFDATGAAATITDTFVYTARVKQDYPNQASPTTSTVALSDYIYSTDTIAGVTNNSAETSPKPIPNWIMPHRLIVGNTIGDSSTPLEILSGHRNARSNRQVAATKFLLTDAASGSVSATSVATVVSGRAGDRNAVVVNSPGSMDISALANGLVTVNGEVYPWIGGSASVAKSATDGNAARGFSPRYFLKNPTKAANPPYACVASTGNDTTGVVSLTMATAAATPFLTVAGAIRGLSNSAVAGNVVDGGEILIMDTVGGGTSAVASNQNIGAVTVRRHPSVSKAAALVQFSVAFRARLSAGLVAPITTGCVRFTDCSLQRTAAVAFQGEAAPTQLEVIVDNCNVDSGGFSASWMNNAHCYWYGCDFTNTSGSTISPGTYENRIFRGCSADLNFSSIEGYLVVGCSITRPGSLARGARSFDGGATAFNTFRTPDTNAILSILGDSQDVTGYFIGQNVFEFTSATSASILKVSGDSATGNNVHVVIHNNTLAGFFANGRSNLFYDDGATARTSKLHSTKGNIHVQINTKGQLFMTSASRKGNEAYEYGVGAQGEFSQYIDAESGGPGARFAQVYPGLGAKIGTSATVRNDPLFTNYQATTNTGTTPVAGAGGGTYTIGSGSLAKAMLTAPVLSHDAAGSARPSSNDTAGAFV